MVGSVTNNSSTSSTGSSATSAVTSAATQSQNFLKLLVAQLNNQDPMNPMDNAEMTSQIAQINTVSGIEQLNTTVSAMSSQFSGMQVMQGASLIGHTVLANGNTINIKNGTGTAGVNLASAATGVTVTVKSPSGTTLDTLNLGALPAGNNVFNWPNASSYTGTGAPTFTVTATASGQAVTATGLIADSVTSVGNDSTGAMDLTLSSGTVVPYSTVQQLY